MSRQTLTLKEHAAMALFTVAVWCLGVLVQVLTGMSFPAAVAIETISVGIAYLFIIAYLIYLGKA